MGTSVYLIIIPVVVVVVILKICLIFWRIWLYQKRRERVYLVQANQQQQQQSRASARVIGVERSMGPEGFTQRTSYLVSQPGLPARQVTRTVVIRPNDNRRPNDPNLPPSYDNAVTGQDKSVKVEEVPPAAPQPSAPPSFEGAGYAAQVPPSGGTAGIPPPAYSTQPPTLAPILEDDHHNEETRLLLP